MTLTQTTVTNGNALTPVTPVTHAITPAFSLARPVMAVQWTGTHDALRALQTLMFPSSPLWAGSLDPRDSLGIKVRSGDSRQYGVPTTLVFAKVGDWIVKDSDGDLAIYSQEAFEKGFSVPTAVDDDAHAHAQASI